jgi:hypothetical protein
MESLQTFERVFEKMANNKHIFEQVAEIEQKIRILGLTIEQTEYIFETNLRTGRSRPSARAKVSSELHFPHQSAQQESERRR